MNDQTTVTTNRNETPPVHDTKRCPECDTYGTVVDVDTRSDELANVRTIDGHNSKDWEKVRYRRYQCPDCEQRWDFYK